MSIKKPNIVFFFTDQQRWDTCGCYGQPLPVTPFLDNFAKKSVLFKNAFTCQPVCGPARSCLQSGVYPTQKGCYRNDIGLPPDTKTLAKLFSENGYKVGYIGKWHLASNYSDFSGTTIPEGVEMRDYKTKPIPENLRGGWKDQWIASDLLEFTSHAYDGYLYDKDNVKKIIPDGEYRTNVLTNWAIEQIEAWEKQEDAFFLFVSYLEPHHQNDHNHYEGPKGSKEKFRNYVAPEDLRSLPGGDWLSEYPDYLGAINNLDSNFGRIQSKLEALGIMENTYLVFTSDHGSHFRTRNKNLSAGNYDDYKRTCHDAATHIPLIIGGGASSKGLEVESLVSLIDLPPTLLKLAGLPIPNHFAGYSLEKIIKGLQKTAVRDSVFMQISESQIGRAIRTDDWCYCVAAADKNGWDYMNAEVYTETYLYDLRNDPFQLHNIITDPKYKNVKNSLRKLLLADIQRFEHYTPTIIDL